MDRSGDPSSSRFGNCCRLDEGFFGTGTASDAMSTSDEDEPTVRPDSPCMLGPPWKPVTGSIHRRAPQNASAARFSWLPERRSARDDERFPIVGMHRRPSSAEASFPPIREEVRSTSPPVEPEPRSSQTEPSPLVRSRAATFPGGTRRMPFLGARASARRGGLPRGGTGLGWMSVLSEEPQAGHGDGSFGNIAVKTVAVPMVVSIGSTSRRQQPRSHAGKRAPMTGLRLAQSKIPGNARDGTYPIRLQPSFLCSG